MPCNSDHMNATSYERDLSRVACLLDELAANKPINPSHLDGYHPRVYSKGLSRAQGDGMVRDLCNALQHRDVTKFSLEMQMWWRDHQAADKARVEREMAKAATEAERHAALGKLTPHERKLLGF